ncbi:hypothetical protein [Paenibacillus hexagrammi]|uniref:Uncharacterized protein n=1 Tax=Paenibacillus hexagrammi TaxID=2908839 RepID=A0ABY3SHE7_9BACL|nr:hypothetical protein [Paenibacillus sp. YPD9-1]UJF33434.1 hypothetical protein L0M14_28670 [Paenibacillus sp. YPD9-1]
MMLSSTKYSSKAQRIWSKLVSGVVTLTMVMSLSAVPLHTPQTRHSYLMISAVIRPGLLRLVTATRGQKKGLPPSLTLSMSKPFPAQPMLQSAMM